MEQELNGGEPIDLARSLFVGDAAGREGDFDCSDRDFAANVGAERGGILAFRTPEQAFGAPSIPAAAADPFGAAAVAVESPSTAVLQTRVALLGGYARHPLLLVLCGPQGSGKSFFCAALLHAAPAWVHVSQDTINNGKPGPRDKVERAARAALDQGRSVVVDRMHLDAAQRAHFVEVARACGAPVHALVLHVPTAELQRRVRERTGHPGNVMGESGARMAAKSAAQLELPRHVEGFAAVTRAHTERGAARVCALYARLQPPAAAAAVTDVGAASHHPLPPPVPPPGRFELYDGSFLPSVALGACHVCRLTYHVPPRAPHAAARRHRTRTPRAPTRRARITRRTGPHPGTMELKEPALGTMLRGGFAAVDTAPTYNNETAVGAGLQRDRQYLICKVPRKFSGTAASTTEASTTAASTTAAVRATVATSLRRLCVRRCDLLLLHWPDKAIEDGTLGEVWGAMEAAREAGECGALGVCNFSVAALQTLLPLCTSSPPAVNQVERHPLCQQRELLEFCTAQRIVLQAHTPLGQGKAQLLQHEAVVRVARASGLTPAGVLLRWNLAHGVAVAPKCSSKAHADDVLEATTGTLAPEHMAALDAIDTTYRFLNPPFMARPAGRKAAQYRW